MGSKQDQLNQEEYEKLFSTATSIKHKLIIALAGEAGLRAGEIAHLNKTWIDFQDKKIKIPNQQGQWKPKTKKSQRTIPYRHNTRLDTLITKYFTTHEQIGTTRQTINRTIKRIAKQASIPHNVYPHALRSTAAQRFADAGLDTQNLRSIMGWAQLQTAEAYVEASGRKAEQALMNLKQRGMI